MSVRSTRLAHAAALPISHSQTTYRARSAALDFNVVVSFRFSAPHPAIHRLFTRSTGMPSMSGTPSCRP